MLSSGTAKSATTAKRRERFITLSAISLRVAKPRGGGGQSGWVAGLQSNTKPDSLSLLVGDSHHPSKPAPRPGVASLFNELDT